MADWEIESVTDAAPDPTWEVESVTPIKQRTLGERAGENFVDAAARNPTVAATRQDFSDPLSALAPFLNPTKLPSIAPPVMRMGSALTRVLTDNLGIKAPALLDAKAERERRERYEAQSASDPFYTAPGGALGKTAAGGATLAGQLGGALTDPLNYANFGKTILTRILSEAGMNAAGDAATQTADINSKTQDKYNPLQTLAAGALAVPIAGGFEGARLGGEMFKGGGLLDAPFITGKARPAEKPGFSPAGAAQAAGRWVVDRVEDIREAPARAEAARYAEAVAKPWTVEDLWGGLEKQEGARGKMDVVSPKGAKGPGQLMPATAQYVANKLGRPELAAAALSDDPNMAWANRLLGQTYLKEQLDAFDGDPALALAAYNAGPTAVKKWIARFGKPDEVGRAKWVEMIPFGETRNYVKKILGDSVGAPVKLAEPELQARAQYMADQARTQEPAQPDVQAEMQKAATEQQAQAEKAVETAGQQQAATVEQAQQDLTARSQEIDKQLRVEVAPRGTSPGMFSVMVNGEKAGEITLAPGGAPFVDRVQLSDDWRGKGVAEAAYDQIEQQIGRTLVPSPLGLTEDASRFWAKRLDRMSPEQRAAAIDEAFQIGRGFGLRDEHLENRLGGFRREEAPEGPQNAGPEDWNEPEPVDAGDEFDRLSGTGKYAQPKPARERDLTDDALDIMRSGKAVQVGQGESLIGALVREGGVRDEGGELTNILGGAGDTQLLKRLRRVNTGMALDDATLWAWQRGYIGKPDGDRPHIQELLDAIGEEGAGRKRYAQNNEEARLVQERIESLDEMLGYLGMDPRTHSNDEIRAAMDDFMESANRFEDDMAPRYDEELEPGSMGLGGKGGASSDHAKAKAAGFRIKDMDAILGSTKQNLREQPRAGAVPMKPGEALPKVKGIHTIAKTLLKKLDLVRRQGRVGMKGALGTYNHTTGMIRTKGAQELDVVAHEIGHAIEYTKKFPTLERTMAAYEPFLQALDYDPAAGRRWEGFAEWFRWYVTNPTFAEKLSPGFYRDFEAAMKADSPKDLATIREAQGDYQDFLNAPSVAAARSQVVEPEGRGLFNTVYRKIKDRGLMGAVTDFSDEVYRGVFDSLNPWKKAVDEAKRIYQRNKGRALDLRVVQDPYKLLRSMPAVASAGHMDIMYGVHGYHELDPGSPALADALKEALGDKFFKWDPEGIRDFGTYLVAKRARDLYDNYAAGKMDQPPDILSREFWEQTIADAEIRNPQYADAADMIYDWNDALLKKQLDAGFIDQQTYSQIRADHPQYVPLNRDVSDRGQVGGKRGSGTDKAGGVIRLKGSDRAYINPIHSMMQRSYELNAMIARNDALVALDDLGQMMGPDGGGIVERLPATEMRATRADALEVLDNAAKEIGVSAVDRMMINQTLQGLFGQKALTNIYRAVDMTPRAGENVVWVWRNGESIPLQLPDGKWGEQMIETLSGATPPMSNLAMEFAAIPARMLRYGVTAHPSFFLANWIRDQFTASVLTDVGYIPGVDNIRGIGADMSQADLSRKYNLVGGHSGGQNVAAEQRARGERDVQALRTKGKRLRHFASWDGLARFTEVSETGTRLGIFDRGMRKFRKEGMDEWAAAKEAGFEARDYMDFERHGGFPGARASARLIPFFNAALQGLDKTTRVARPATFFQSDLPKWIGRAFFGGAPISASEQRAVQHAGKLWLVAATLGVGSLALRAAFADDPEYEEIADYLRNTHWVFPLPGTDEYVVIPKPYDVAALSNIMERAYEATTMHDPTAWGRLAVGLKDIWLPPIDAPVAMMPLELMSNKDSFGIQIVPESKVGSLPRDQKREGTSPLAIQFTEMLRTRTGGKVDLSPAQAEFVFKSMGGTIARDVLRMGVEKAPVDKKMSEMPVISRFVKDWTRGPISQKEFFKLVATEDGKYSREANSMADLVMAGNAAEATARLGKMDPATRAYVMTSVFAQGQDKQSHPLIRATMASRELGELARNLVDNDVLVPGPKGLEPLRLNPSQRRAAIDGLRKMQVAEQRNALIAVGVPGWAGVKDPLPREKYMREIERAAPGVLEVLAVRNAVNKIVPAEVAYQQWSAVRPMLERQQDPTILARMIQAKMASGSGAVERVLKTPVPVEAASR